MTSAQRRLDRGTQVGTALRIRLGQELRDGRLAAGLSQAQLGAAARMSASEVSRLERARVPAASLVAFAELLSIVGLKLSAKAYPDGPPVRDAAHARLLLRLKARLPPGVRLRLEVPVRADPGDLRAWDAEIRGDAWSVKVEAETRLRDIQALDRRIGLKAADSRDPVVILLVAATRSNAAALREFGPLLRERYPLNTRDVLAALRTGSLPSSSGICVL